VRNICFTDALYLVFIGHSILGTFLPIHRCASLAGLCESARARA